MKCANSRLAIWVRSDRAFASISQACCEGQHELEILSAFFGRARSSQHRINFAQVGFAVLNKIKLLWAIFDAQSINFLTGRQIDYWANPSVLKDKQDLVYLKLMLNISRRMMNGFGRSLARSAAPSPHGDWSAIQARHPRLISWASSRISPEIVLNTIPNLGYAAENLTLRHARKAFTSRSCHRRTFDDKGLTHISRLALQNCQDLRHVIAWNHANNINFFRISSKLIPWAGKYPLEALPDFPAIADALATAGELARTLGQRITSHPPHFIKLAATNEALQQQSIATLEVQNQVFDLMGFPPSHWNKVRWRSQTCSVPPCTDPYGLTAFLMRDADQHSRRRVVWQQGPCHRPLCKLL